MYRLFEESEASLVEINPLVVTAAGELLALEAKINLDDNALYRQTALAEQRDATRKTRARLATAEHELKYISLDGNIGCMVNGAGLAMAPWTWCKLHGGKPANFLDVGGGTTAERVAGGFQTDPVRWQGGAVLVNIFGGSCAAT